MTKEEFTNLMSRLLVAYPNFRINEQGYQAVWRELLMPLRYDYAKLAVQKYTTEGLYAPTPADIITRYRAIEELNRHRLSELKEIFRLSRQYYPKELWTEDDEKTFMSAVKSETFDDCKAKARKILQAFIDCEKAEMTYTEFVRGQEW